MGAYSSESTGGSCYPKFLCFKGSISFGVGTLHGQKGEGEGKKELNLTLNTFCRSVVHCASVNAPKCLSISSNSAIRESLFLVSLAKSLSNKKKLENLAQGRPIECGN